MYAALSQLLYLWDLEEQRGRGVKVIVWREAEGGKPQNQMGGGGTFYGAVDPSSILLELPTYFYDMHYIILLLIKT